MADNYIVGEIIKYFELKPGDLFYHLPFVYKTIISIQGDLDSYFITVFGAQDVTRKEYVLIQGVYVNVKDFYHPQETLQDCIDNAETIFFDVENQELYIHFNHSVNPVLSSVEYGKTIGFTNDDVREFNNIDYDPEIQSIPNYQERVDALKYTKQAFYGGNINHNNKPTLPGNKGRFDEDSKLFGNDYNILLGKNGDSYNDLTGIAKTYITNAKTSFNKLNLAIKDKREQENIKIPEDTFELFDFPDLDEDLIGKIKPDGYGTLSDVPGFCVNSNSTGNKLWYFCSKITDTPEFIVQSKKSDNWVPVTPISVDYENGIVELSIADSHVDSDSSKGLLSTKASGLFISVLDSLPPDIIIDLNERFLNIAFNDSNYNTTEWNDEKQYLKPVGLYMDNQRNIFDWIGILQASSTVGFLYRNEYGKRTIRLDNPNRDPVINIEAIDIINNSNLVKDDNAELFATHAIVYYNKKYSEILTKGLSSTIRDVIRNGKISGITVSYFANEKYENRDYYNQVFSQHRKDNPIELETLLLNKQDAIDKSIIIMEDQQKTRPIVNIEVWGKVYFQLRLFDIVNAELSFPGKKTGVEKNDTWRVQTSAPDTYVVTIDTGPTYRIVNYTEKDIYINRREFMGWQRMQIIGKKFNFKKATITLTLRQRDFSTKYQEITGFLP